VGDRGYRIYGDSAYGVLNDPFISHHDDDEPGAPGSFAKQMSCARETIEWNYGHLKTMFKAVDTPKRLRLRRNRVEDMVLTAFVMRNAWVSMYGSQTTLYFNCPAPQFEDWVAAGPRNALEG